MTRFLSHLLEAPEPFFRLGLRKLEEANGNPSADIRFSTEIFHAAKRKIPELDLDPGDTTAKELFRALEQRLRADDERLARTLRTKAATHVSAEADVVAGMVHALRELPDAKHCYALKASSLKKLLKNQPPKKAMKQLGYRSMASFLKHEAPILILAAAWLSEGEAWQRRLLEQYKKLAPTDFENRAIILAGPDSAKWQDFAAKLVDDSRHNLICFKEFGALVFLPLPKNVPDGVVTVSLSLALHELNEIRAASSFLQVHQVSASFGESVSNIATDEPRLSSELLDQPMPWNLIQRYYARLTDRSHGEIFEPHMELDAMAWHPVEQTLSMIEPSFKFWQNTAHMGLLDNGKPVSFNLVDVALNFCNKIAYEERAAHYFQKAVWHELMLRYLKRDSVENAVLSELQPKLATETITA